MGGPAFVSSGLVRLVRELWDISGRFSRSVGDCWTNRPGTSFVGLVSKKEPGIPTEPML